MKYIKYFEATVLGQKVKDFKMINDLYEHLGVTFKYSYQGSRSMCIINFNLNNDSQLNYIANIICNVLENNNIQRVCFNSSIEGQEIITEFRFQLNSTNTFQQVINKLLEYFEENVSDNISYYSKGNRKSYLCPMFKNIIIRYTKYLKETENPDKESIWKIIGEEISKSGVDFKVLNYIENNNQPLWHRIYNEINDVGSKMGNLGF